jgi:integrase
MDEPTVRKPSFGCKLTPTHVSGRLSPRSIRFQVCEFWRPPPPQRSFENVSRLAAAVSSHIVFVGRNAKILHTIALITYRFVCDLEWAQVEMTKNAVMHVRRIKNGTPSVHPIRGDEVVRQLQREQDPPSAFVFTTQRGGPFTPEALNNLVKALGKKTKLAFPIHCHMLRHACGYALANAGHDTRALQAYLRHRGKQARPICFCCCK